MVLNSDYQRWQIQDNDNNTNKVVQDGGETICYAYCNRAFAQPERCAAQPWMVLNRDGSYSLYDGNIMISTSSSYAQLEVTITHTHSLYLSLSLTHTHSYTHSHSHSLALTLSTLHTRYATQPRKMNHALH